jgi:hypothetical protein
MRFVRQHILPKSIAVQVNTILYLDVGIPRNGHVRPAPDGYLRALNRTELSYT